MTSGKATSIIILSANLARSLIGVSFHVNTKTILVLEERIHQLWGYHQPVIANDKVTE